MNLMTRDSDLYIKVSSPRIFLVRMFVFLTLCALVAILLNRPIWAAFLSNPGLNGIILGALVVGILMSIRQVLRLFREIRWVNNFRLADPGLAVSRPPVLLAPMAALLGDRMGRMSITQSTMRGILDSIGTRLEEAREVARYLTGLLVFLGLLGTFWGLLETVSSIGKVVQSLEVGADAGRVFEDLKSGLAAPLGGMGIAFSSSLFGLAGSLILGFLDLQAGQAQNRFYTDLEDWLSTTVRDLGSVSEQAEDGLMSSLPRIMIDEFSAAIARLEKVVGETGDPRGTKAMVQLAESLQGLVQHMRGEQQMLRDWVESQAEQQNEIRSLLVRLARIETIGGM